MSATHLMADVQGYLQTIDGDASTAVGSATIPPAGTTPLSVVTVFYAARSYGNALVRARVFCGPGVAHGSPVHLFVEPLRTTCRRIGRGRLLWRHRGGEAVLTGQGGSAVRGGARRAGMAARGDAG